MGGDGSGVGVVVLRGGSRVGGWVGGCGGWGWAGVNGSYRHGFMPGWVRADRVGQGIGCFFNTVGGYRVATRDRLPGSVCPDRFGPGLFAPDGSAQDRVGEVFRATGVGCRWASGG